MRLGCDPEVFLVNVASKFVSAVGLIPGTKEEPEPIAGMAEGFTVQQDNVAMELGIPPASSAEEFDQSIRQVLLGVKAYHKGLSQSMVSSAVFPKSQLNTAGANHFGCEPDYNAWTGEPNPKPVLPEKGFRSAGGHIHVETSLDKRAVIRGLDLYIGLPSLFLDPDGHARRVLYGKAGAYRPKSYGVEYRTPSNFWIFSETRRMWVFNQCLTVVEQVGAGRVFLDYRVQEAIDSNNLELAAALMAEYQVSY